MRHALGFFATTCVGLLAAACGVSSGSDHEETLGTLQQPVPFPTIVPTIKPPSFHLQPFTTTIANAAGSYEAALRVRAVRVGVDGYVVLARRITTTPKLSVSYLVYRLDTHGAPVWSRPFSAPLGYTLQDIREYQGPGFSGFALAGYTGSTCTGSCTSNSGLLMVLDSSGFERATSFYAPPGDGTTRLRALNQAPDGSLLAVGDTTTMGNCQRSSGGSYYKPLGQRAGFFVSQENELTGSGGFVTSKSVKASLCPEPRRGALPTNTDLQGLIVMGDARRVVAVGSRLNDLNHRYEALNLALEPGGATGWRSAVSALLLSAAAYGDGNGDTRARAIARVDADSFIFAGSTASYNSGARSGDAGFMRRHRLGNDGTFVNEWLTGDSAAGSYLTPLPGWRLFGGSLANHFDDVAIAGNYVVAVGSADQAWNDRYLTQRTLAPPTDNALMARANVADGDGKLLRGLPIVSSLLSRRPYDAGLSGVAGTLGPGFFVGGFAKRLDESSKVLVAQLDPDLTFDGSFVPPADPEPPQDPDPPEPDPWAQAEATFTKRCKSCHGADHAGQGDVPCLIGVSRSCAVNRLSCGVANTIMNSYCDRLNFDQVEDLADYLVAYVPGAGVTCKVQPKCGQATGLPECHEDLCAQ